jgi:hypothetical protein
LKWIKEVVEKYKSIDDVWEEAFLATVLIIHPKRPDVDVSEDARAYLNARGTKRIITRTVNESETQILPGPYTFSGRSLYAAWKLYEDTHNAFLHTLVQDSKGYVHLVARQFVLMKVSVNQSNFAQRGHYPRHLQWPSLPTSCKVLRISQGSEWRPKTISTSRTSACRLVIELTTSFLHHL